jgi:hypothetical protein
VSYGESVTIEETLTAEVTLSSAIKNFIVGELGASYSISASSNESFGCTMNIGAGKRARVMFAPMMRYTEGTYTLTRTYNNGESITTRDVSGYVPVKVGNFADGEYYLKYE